MQVSVSFSFVIPLSQGKLEINVETLRDWLACPALNFAVRRSKHAVAAIEFA